MTSTSQLRVLTLNAGEVLETTIFRLEKGWILQFVLGPSLAGKRVRVFTNHPVDAKSGYNRQQYRELHWQNLTGRKFDVYDNFAAVTLIISGSFNYFFTIDGSDKPSDANGSGYFLVDPVLVLGKMDERVSLDALCCQTYLAKCLGSFPEWTQRLRVAKECGYNMVHFTPLQELGESNSSYCLKDQLQLNSLFQTNGSKYTMDDVAHLVKTMQKEWGVLSLTDLVFNHTANETPWLKEHPECTYNMITAPHLKPAYILDRILWNFSLEIGEGKWAGEGIPAEIRTEEHLSNIRRVLHQIIPKYKLHEFFMMDIAAVEHQFSNQLQAGVVAANREGTELRIIADPKCRRLRATVDMPLAVNLFYVKMSQWMEQHERTKHAKDLFKEAVEKLNREKKEEVDAHIHAAVENVVANARWRFLDPAGPKVPKVAPKEPIMWNYFTLPDKHRPPEHEEEIIGGPEGAFAMAHNGWVMNDDPMRNFAEEGSNIYFRRELLPWGDSVKLRYGKSPSDCPFLWEHMRAYTVAAAKAFHGVRLDNCHSTPIHVAEYMLDEGRKVNPNLYVIAELFTNSEFKDNVFINRLGLSSLIREGLNAHNSHELGRLVHRYGGSPVGSFIQPLARPLMPCMAHAMFLDQTHDNPSPVEKRTALDLLPSAALVSMACCATGSNRGYDELVPHHIHVVTEGRRYQSWSDQPTAQTGTVNNQQGIIAARRALNKLHSELGLTGFTQVYVDQVNEDIVSVTRHNPVNHQSIILMARTVFSKPHSLDTGYIPVLSVPGTIDEIVLEAVISPRHHAEGFVKDKEFINGLGGEYSLKLREHLKVSESDMVQLKNTQNSGYVQELEFACFPPGSVIAMRISLHSSIKNTILQIRQMLSNFGYRVPTYSGRSLDEMTSNELESIVTRLSLSDLNRVLYRCDAEERDDRKGFGAYVVPGYGPLVYCGLQGIMSVLNKIRPNNDLGHPLCNNIRDGDWLADYTAKRLQAHPGTRALGNWLANAFQNVSNVPRYLVPCYFDALVTGVYAIVEEVAWAKLSPFVSKGSSFVRALGLGSVQFCGVVPTASLPLLSADLAPPRPPTEAAEDTGKVEQACVTMAAGLPHFSSGIFRCWGRDTFIALRGLLLITGRFAEARFIILAFGGCLRHGLIPNLLGGGVAARYNCRDAVWWWLQCIQDYCTLVPDGTNILKDKVARLYTSDDAPADIPGVDEPLANVMQEALQRHAQGIRFRERNAGPDIDRDMSTQGFSVEAGIHWDTGFVYGGSGYNCGTWMDKMGSSDRAGNKGKPATPRDGSAVELVGLCASTVKWLAEMHASQLYPFDGVDKIADGHRVKVTFAEWYENIRINFERCFWISKNIGDADDRPELINRRGIYKDSYGASSRWQDYQLRPNFPIAMVVAPELFDAVHAKEALDIVEYTLLGPLGMKTLDPSDWNYRGFYDNSNDSGDFLIAKGFNYHQGPEWLWPIGFFLRAKLQFAKQLSAEQSDLLPATIDFVHSTLVRHCMHIFQSDWRSLPELTNQDGAVCNDSCPAQAWSVSCILDALYSVAVVEGKSS